jgi:hypothetical protein
VVVDLAFANGQGLLTASAIGAVLGSIIGWQVFQLKSGPEQKPAEKKAAASR